MSLLTGCLPSWGESPGIELQSHIACVLQHVTWEEETEGSSVQSHP